MTSKRIFLVLLLFCTPMHFARAQRPVGTSGDSLVDVFPLSVGYRWTYFYQYMWDQYDQSSPQYHWGDTGTVELRVLDKLPAADSIRWVVQESGVHWTQYNSNPWWGPTVQSDTFEIIEYTAGNHRLVRTGDSADVVLSVLPFSPTLPDTACPFRYARVDSAGLRRFQYNNYAPDYRFSFKQGVGLLYGNTGVFLTGAASWSTGHLLRDAILVSVSEHPAAEQVRDFLLGQNYPNPFNPRTMIPFHLPQRSRVTLTVYNTLGQKVRDLLHGELQAGYHEVSFNAGDLSSGVYLYRLTSRDQVQVRKLLLLR